MRIDVVRDRCEGHGICEEIAPSLYSLDEEGYVIFVHEGVDVPGADRAAAIAGARVCPVAALLVQDTE